MRYKIIFLGIMGGLIGFYTFKNNAVSLPISSPFPVNISAQPSSFHALEQETHKQINQYRRSRGLPILRLDARISDEARRLSQKMAQKKAPLNDNEFQNRVNAIARFIPVDRAAENTSSNQGYTDPVTASVQGWIKNPDNRKNIEGDFNLTGIGVDKNATGEYYFTQIFIKQQTSSIQTLEQETHKQVNQYRRSKGLPPLHLDARISNVSRLFSQKMAQGKAPFNHNGFQNRISAIAKFIPIKSAGENLAFNQGYSNPVSLAVQGWIKSPGHRKNMEGDFNLTGIGIARNTKGEYYFTQIFVKK